MLKLFITEISVTAKMPIATRTTPMIEIIASQRISNANEIAKTMCDNVDVRKWICVTAEKVYTTSSGDVACLIMAAEDVALPIYENFKQKAGVVGQEYQKTAEEPELPADMY